MNNKLVIVISFASIFVTLTSTSGWILNVNAQGDSFRSDSSSEIKTTPLDNISSIITPWNTGNERNNSGASSPG